MSTATKRPVAAGIEWALASIMAALDAPNASPSDALCDRAEEIMDEISRLSQESAAAAKVGGESDLLTLNEQASERLLKELRAVQSDLEDYEDGAPDASAAVKRVRGVLAELEAL